MKIILLLLLILPSIPIFIIAQEVYIPDPNFKTYLLSNTTINTNLDDSIQLSEANSYTGSIWVPNFQISDMTGIEAFTKIGYLNCNSNNLNFLDVSNNDSLLWLYCSNNQIAELNIENNTILEDLQCDHNLITSLDFSLSSLLGVICNNNLLTEIDISSSPNIGGLECDSNQLNYLNISNGNTNLNGYWSQVSYGVWDITYTFHAIFNPDLFCITVSDVVEANSLLSGPTVIDPWASFSDNCTVSVNNNHLNRPFVIEDNGTIYISQTGTAQIYNIQGQEILSAPIPAQIEIKESGIYIVRVESNKQFTTHKILIK